MTACGRCKRDFESSRSLGQHTRALREAVGPAAKARICPDNRTNEEAREQDARLARLLAKTGLRKRLDARRRTP